MTTTTAFIADMPITPLLRWWAMTRFGVTSGRGRALSIARGSDGSLVADAARGDRQAFDELYNRYVDLVWVRLGRLIGPDPEREDLLQQIFFDLFRSLPGFRQESSFWTFLYRIVLNTAFDHLRQRRRKPVAFPPGTLDELVDDDSSPEERALRKQRLVQTFALLDRIKPKKRIAFLLRVVEGLSLEEIGVLTQSKPAAVAQRIRHAHVELSALIERARSSRGGKT